MGFNLLAVNLKLIAYRLAPSCQNAKFYTDTHIHIYTYVCNFMKDNKTEDFD